MWASMVAAEYSALVEGPIPGTILLRKDTGGLNHPLLCVRDAATVETADKMENNNGALERYGQPPQPTFFVAPSEDAC